MITPDGQTIIAVIEIVAEGKNGHVSSVRQELVTFSARTGKLLRVLNRIPVYGNYEQVLWASPSGQVLIVSGTQPGTTVGSLGTGATAGVLRHGRFTPIPLVRTGPSPQPGSTGDGGVEVTGEQGVAPPPSAALPGRGRMLITLGGRAASRAGAERQHRAWRSRTQTRDVIRARGARPDPGRRWRPVGHEHHGEAATLRSEEAAARALRRKDARPVTADEESFTAAWHHAVRSMETTQVTAASSLAALAAAGDAAARAHLHALNIPGRNRHSPREQKARPKFPHTSATKPTVTGKYEVIVYAPGRH